MISLSFLQRPARSFYPALTKRPGLVGHMHLRSPLPLEKNMGGLERRVLLYLSSFGKRGHSTSLVAAGT